MGRAVVQDCKGSVVWKQVGGQAVRQAGGLRVGGTITWVSVYEWDEEEVFISHSFYLRSFFAMPIWVYPFSNYIWKGQCCQGGLVDVCAAWCVTFLTWRSHTTPCLCLSGRHAWGPLEGCLRLVWKIKWPPLEFVVVLLTSLLRIWIAEDAVLVRFLFKM